MRKEFGYLVSAVTATALAACATVPVVSSIGSEDQSSANTISTVEPSPTPTELFPGLNTVGLLTPEVRAAAYQATQQAFAAKDAKTLEQEGFPDQIKASQNTLTNKYKLEVTAGNNPPVTYDYAVSMNATMVNLDGTPYGNFILAITAGHGFSSDNQKVEAQKDLQPRYGVQKVTVNSADFVDFTLGTNGPQVKLNRNQFGLDLKYNPDREHLADQALVLIPKANLPTTVLAKLMQGAIPADMLSFEPFSTDDKIYAVCTPPGGPTTVIAEGAKYTGDSKNFVGIGPSLTKDGCSGTGEFAVNTEGQVKFKGIDFGKDLDEQNFNLESFVYPLSATGRGEFWDRIAKAANDPDMAK